MKRRIAPTSAAAFAGIAHAASRLERIVLTLRERRAIELKLLDLQLEEQRLRAQNVIDLAAQGKASPQDAAIARSTLDGLPVLRDLARRRIERDTEGSAAQYRREIYGDINERVEDIETAGLRALEDTLLNSTKAALGLSGALGNVVGELLRIGIQRKLIGPLADQLFGKADGSNGSGSLGGLFQSIAGAFGGARASGGPVSAGKTYLVGERGPELLRMQGAGTVIPNHQIGVVNASMANTRVAQRAPSITVIAPQHFDLKGVLMTEPVLREMEARNRDYADAVASQAGKQALQLGPTYAAKRQQMTG